MRLLKSLARSLKSLLKIQSTLARQAYRFLLSVADLEKLKSQTTVQELSLTTSKMLFLLTQQAKFQNLKTLTTLALWASVVKHFQASLQSVKLRLYQKHKIVSMVEKSDVSSDKWKNSLKLQALTEQEFQSKTFFTTSLQDSNLLERTKRKKMT